jgi:hypothetical protein
MNMLPLGEIRGLTKLIKTTAVNFCAKAAMTPSMSMDEFGGRHSQRLLSKSQADRRSKERNEC